MIQLNPGPSWGQNIGNALGEGLQNLANFKLQQYYRNQELQQQAADRARVKQAFIANGFSPGEAELYANVSPQERIFFQKTAEPVQQSPIANLSAFKAPSQSLAPLQVPSADQILNQSAMQAIGGPAQRQGFNLQSFAQQFAPQAMGQAQQFAPQPMAQQSASPLIAQQANLATQGKLPQASAPAQQISPAAVRAATAPQSFAPVGGSNFQRQFPDLPQAAAEVDNSLAGRLKRGVASGGPAMRAKMEFEEYRQRMLNEREERAAKLRLQLDAANTARQAAKIESQIERDKNKATQQDIRDARKQKQIDQKVELETSQLNAPELKVIEERERNAEQVDKTTETILNLLDEGAKGTLFDYGTPEVFRKAKTQELQANLRKLALQSDAALGGKSNQTRLKALLESKADLWQDEETIRNLVNDARAAAQKDLRVAKVRDQIFRENKGKFPLNIGSVIKQRILDEDAAMAQQAQEAQQAPQEDISQLVQRLQNNGALGKSSNIPQAPPPSAPQEPIQPQIQQAQSVPQGAPQGAPEQAPQGPADQGAFAQMIKERGLLPDNIAPAPDYSLVPEDLGQMLERNTMRALTRGAEVASGSVGSGLELLTALGNYASGGRLGSYKDLQEKSPVPLPPTIGQQREKVAQRTKGYLEPRNEPERVLDDVVSDVVGLSLGPTQGAKEIATKVGLGNAASWLARKLNFGEGAQLGAKLGVMTLAGLRGTKDILKNKSQDLYKQVDKLAGDKKVVAEPLLNQIDKLEKFVESGAKTEAKEYLTPIIKDVSKHLSEYKVPVKQLIQIEKDLYDLGAKAPSGATSMIYKMRDTVSDMLSNFGKSTPGFNESLSKAKDIWKGITAQGAATKFLNHVTDPDTIMKSSLGKILLGKGVGAALAKPALALSGAAKTGLALGVGGNALKGVAQVWDLLRNSSEARKYYAQLLASSLAKNTAGTLASAKNLDKAILKYEKKK